MKVKSESEVAQSGLTPSDPTDCSLPGSSVHGILQVRVLEWGAIALIGLKKENYMPRACSIFIFFSCLECLPHPSFPVMSRTGVTTTSPMEKLRLLEVKFFKVKIWSIVSITWELVRTVISQDFLPDKYLPFSKSTSLV